MTCLTRLTVFCVLKISKAKKTMKRPKIEECFPEATGLNTIADEYAKSPVVTRYAKALDEYADRLEKRVRTLEIMVELFREIDSHEPEEDDDGEDNP